MSGIFISYRRQDTSGYAGRLYERLSKHFGKQRVFMDIDTLQPGLDFGQALDQAVSSCEVLIALIGPNWLNAVDADGRRRLENPDDFVRMEIAAALARDGVRVVPVLVGNASLPRADSLPSDLKPLARRQSVEISDNRWEYDLARLIDRLELVVPRVRGVTGAVTSRRSFALALPVLLALVALTLRLDLLGNGNGANSASTPTSAAVVQTVPGELSTPDSTNVSTPEPTHASDSGEALVVTPGTATPVPTLPSLLTTAGLISETSYTSPQFGYTIEWGDDWELDPGYNPPVRSDDGADSLYLSASGADLAVVGSSPGRRDAAEQRIAVVTSADYLSATFGDRDHEVLHADGNADAGAVVVLERVDNAPSLVHIIETSLLDDGETLMSVHLVAEVDRIESVHALTSESVTRDGGALLGILDADDIVAMLDEATLEPGAVATSAPTASPSVAATPATPSPTAPGTPPSMPGPDTVPTSMSTPAPTTEPTEVTSFDPAMRAAGLVSERRYVSPQYGHSVEWDDTWMLDFDYDAPVISNGDERFDAIHITTAELYTPFMRVAAYDGGEWGSMEDIVERLTSDEWMDMAYPGAQKQVLLQKYAGDRGGMVVARTTDSGQEYIAIFEAYLVDDGETLLLVTMTTTPNQIASAHARTNETVQINEGQALTVFTVDEIGAAVESWRESGAGTAAVVDRITLYESPHFDYTLSWDGHWLPNEATEPAIGYDEATFSDFVNLRASESRSVLLKVGAVETSGWLDIEAAVDSYASESFLTAGFGADHVLLAKDIREDSGGIVLLHTSAGSEYVTIMETVLLEEGSTLVTLIWTAPLSESDEVVAYLESTRAASLQLNGQPLPGGFEADVVFEALARQRAQEPQ